VNVDPCVYEDVEEDKASKKVANIRLFKRSSWPGYMVRYKDENGKLKDLRIPLDKKGEKQALRYAALVIESKKAIVIKKTQESISDTNKATIEQVYHRWDKLRKEKTALQSRGISQSTYLSGQYAFKNYILSELGEESMSTISLDRIRVFVRSLSHRNISIRTQQSICSSFRKFYQDALSHGWVDRTDNPLRHPLVREEMPVVISSSPRRVLYVEMASFWNLIFCDSIDLYWKVWYMLGGLAGLDLGEAAGLKWKDLNFDDEIPSIIIERACQGKHPSWRSSLGPTKRPSRLRILPIHPILLKGLSEWKHSQDLHGRLKHTPELEDPVLPNCTGLHSRPWLSKKIRDHLERTGCKSTYMGKNLNYKCLRRTFSTSLHAAGVSLEILKRLMGHEDDSVTMKHYTNLNLCVLYEAVCRLIPSENKIKNQVESELAYRVKILFAKYLQSDLNSDRNIECVENKV